jgi:hypothetical protein
MSYFCPLCKLDPMNHSFKKIFEKDNCIYFYTKPSDAKLYFDKTGIINHYEGMLNETINNHCKWIWIFDSCGFGLKHSLQTDVAIGLAKLISSKFSENLEKIVIINSNTYIWSIYKIIYPFLNYKIKSIVIFDEKNAWKNFYENI